jgi:hypothetical protein
MLGLASPGADVIELTDADDLWQPVDLEYTK